MCMPLSNNKQIDAHNIISHDAQLLDVPSNVSCLLLSVPHRSSDSHKFGLDRITPRVSRIRLTMPTQRH